MSSGQARAKPLVDHFRLVGQTLEQKFQIERLVAEGGFGVVYRGTQLNLGKPIAVKVLRNPSDLNDRERREFRSRFELEARTVARLSHPNIVHAFDFGVATMPSGEMAPWMVLEWVEGRTLEEINRERHGKGGESPAALLALMRPVLQALAYAHDHGIAHRDVKPANIMVAETRRSSVPRLMDFGIAKAMEEGETTESGETRTKSLVRAFSLKYASPEQLSGTRTGPWTDVHAVALMMVEMLMDAPAYRSREKALLYAEIMSPTRPTPGREGADAGPWEAVLARALAVNPVDRYQHAADFLADLEASVPTALRTTAMRASPSPSGVEPRASTVPVSSAAPTGVASTAAPSSRDAGPPGHAPNGTARTRAPAPVAGVPFMHRPALPWIIVAVSAIIGLALAGAGMLGRSAHRARGSMSSTTEQPRAPGP